MHLDSNVSNNEKRNKVVSKIIAIVLVLLTVISVSSLTIFKSLSSNHDVLAYAATVGWKSDSTGWWYVYNTNGDYYKSSWAQIDGYWYYFKSDGYMATYKNANIKRSNSTSTTGDFYFDGDGHLKTGAIYDSSNNLKYYAATGSDQVYQYSSTASTGQYTYVTGQLYKNSWVQVGDYWYFMGSNNEPVTYRTQIGGKYYYFNGAGIMQTGQINGSNGLMKYYAKDSGELYTNSWLQTGGYWYYMGSNSEPVIYSQTIGGESYYFNGAGKMHTGFLQNQSTGKYFYYRETSETDHPKGSMVTGWKKINNKWYYFYPNATNGHEKGERASGLVEINGKNYYFNSDGSAFSGNRNGTYYKDGEPITTGWTTVNGKYVYIQNGTMLKNQWIDDDGKWYYVGSDGYMYSNRWLRYPDGSNNWYYLKSDGSAATGKYRINGKNYLFNNSGLMTTEENPSASYGGSKYVHYDDVDDLITVYQYLSPFSHKTINYTLHQVDGKYAYCIQLDTSSRYGYKTVQTLEETDAWQNMYSYQKKGITRATIMGYPNYSLGVGPKAAAAATAMIIHEFAQGYRDSCVYGSPYSGLSSADNSTVLYYMAYNNGGQLWQAYSTLNNYIAKFDTNPSFISSSEQLVPATQNSGSNYTYSRTFTDSNNVLDTYVVAYTTNRNVTATISGNKLIVTASSPEELKKANVVLSKKGTTADTQAYGSATALYDKGYQSLVFGTINEEKNVTLKLKFKDEPVYGTINITKIDSITREYLQGAEFTLYNSSNQAYRVLVTDANGKASASNIPIGTYTLMETKPPTGYVNTFEVRTITISKGNTTFNYTIENGPTSKRGNLYLFKFGRYTSKTLKGAKFEIYSVEDENNPIVIDDEGNTEIEINEAGYAFVEDLLVGQYYVVETVAPKGYQLDTSRKYFEITENTRNFTPVTIVDCGDARNYYNSDSSYNYGSVTVNVNSSENSSNKVSGAIIAAYCINSNGDEVCVGTGITGNDGTVVFQNIAYNLNYRFVQLDNLNTSFYKSETEHNISLNEETTSESIVFSNNPNTTVTTMNTVTMYEFHNEPYETTLYKKDAQTLVGLAGATLEVYDSDNTLVYSGITDENGELHLEEIVPGTYTFKEVIAPKGYVVNPIVKTFVINDDGTVDDVENRTITDTKTSVTLVKKDSETLQGVSGATIKITNSSGEVVFNGVTGSNGEISLVGISAGTYFIEETIAPTGYIKSNEIFEFILRNDGTVEGTVEIPNAPNEVIIEKVSTSDGSKLPNTKFEIFDSNNVSKGIFTTDSNGQIVLKKWTPGTYTFVERQAAEGHLLNPTVYNFTLDEFGTVTSTNATVLENTCTVQISNEPNKVIIEKVDSDTGELLGGATFNIYNPDGTLYGTFTTGNDATDTENFGKIILTKLPSGHYTLVETEAPNGYALDSTTKSFDVPANGTSTITVEIDNEPTGELPETGGIGGILMGILAIISIGVGILLSKKKKRNLNNN